jgi:hypothetical protein
MSRELDVVYLGGDEYDALIEERDELRALLTDVVAQTCTLIDDTLSSFDIGVYADAIRAIAKWDPTLRISTGGESGRSIVAFRVSLTEEA